MIDTDPDATLDDLPDTFVVDSDQLATWAMRKLAAAEEKITEANDLVAAEIDRLNRWLEQTTAKHYQDAEFFRGHLTMYALAQRALHDRKTIKTPYGDVKTRTGSPVVNVVDPVALMEFAKASRPELIRTKVEVNKAELNRLICDGDVLTEDGEIVPGVEVTEPTTTATVVIA